MACSKRLRRSSSSRGTAVICENAGPAGPLFVKIAFSHKIFMFAVGAMGSIVPRLALDRMLSATLTPPKRAWILAAKDRALMEVTTTGQFVFHFVQIIHFLAVVLRGQFAERRFVLGRI